MRITIFLLTCLIIFSLKAQPLSFGHLTIDDGLSQSAVFSILQDHKGYMWFGTKDGLNRFDGKNFTIYQHDPFDAQSISDSYVTFLYEDSHGWIWIGTYGGGVNIFHRGKEIFQRVLLPGISRQGAYFREVKAIVEDPDGSVWIGTEGDGLYKLTIDRKFSAVISHVHYVHIPEQKYSMNSNDIHALSFDAKGNLWIGTTLGLSQFKPEENVFIHYSIETPQSPATNLALTIPVISILAESDGNLWLGTTSGLVRFDPVKNRYLWFINEDGVNDQVIRQVIKGNDGSLWMATFTGLLKLEIADRNFTKFMYDPKNLSSISMDLILCLLFDKNGVLWIGTYGKGIDIYDPYVDLFPRFKHIADSNSRVTNFSIRSILQDSENKIWIGAEVLYCWDRENGSVRSFEGSVNAPDLFGNSEIYSMLEDGNKNLWVVSSRGIFRHSLKSQETRFFRFHYSESGTILREEASSVLEDRTGNIWLLTSCHLCKYIDDNSGFTCYRFMNEEFRNSRYRSVLYQNADGKIWMGTIYGLFCFDPESTRFTQYKNDPAQKNSLSHNQIKCITEDPRNPQQYLWIGTSGGLNMFDLRDKTFTHYTEKNGLPNNVVYGALFDDHGNLWLSTNKGLSKFDPSKSTFRNYDVSDGLQSNEFNTGAFFKSKSGEMFFGGIAGLNYFYPDTIKVKPRIINMAITGLRVNGKAVKHKTNPEKLNVDISEADVVILSHRDKIVNIDFTALDFAQPSKRQYAYRLEGYSDEWIDNGIHTSATFTNLPYGNFVFRAKASNSEGVWNEDGISVRLVIKPPWWRSWSAYVLYLVVFILVIIFLRQYELNRLQIKNQLKIEKRESLALRKVDAIKSSFFANISHEFRTPLTMIMAHLECLSEFRSLDNDQKERISLAQQNTNRLLFLINQLLDLSRIESGKMECEKEYTDLTMYVSGCLHSFESMAEVKNIHLSFFAEHTFIPAWVDHEKFRTIIYNLVSNAIKFTDPLGVVEVRLQYGENQTVQLIVRDTGIGIKKEALPHIFKRYYQSGQPGVGSNQGTGIGLALVHQFVELHSWKIQVNSQLGVGTEFVIEIPGAKNSESIAIVNPTDIKVQWKNLELNDAPVSVSKKIIPPERTVGEVILIVEDNIELRSLIRQQFEKFYCIIEAANGLDGLEMALTDIPDLIITDVMMPGMNGMEFSAAIRNNEKTSHIPIIMLSGKAELENRIQGLETGADAYLTKPFNMKELRLLIFNMIQQRKKFREKFSKSYLIKPSEISVIPADQAFFEKVVQFINCNLQDPRFGVDQLAEMLNMSTSQLNRKINALIEQTPGHLVRTFRLRRAADLLKSGMENMAEVCELSGFNDQAYFSRAFKKEFGVQPSKYLK